MSTNQPAATSDFTQPDFREALEACLGSLRTRALKLCLNRSDAEDLVQDTIVRALRFQQTFRPGTNLQAWCQQILYSVFVTRCRKRGREQRAMEAFRRDPNTWNAATTSVTPRTLPASVSIALDALPDKFRSVVHLVDLEELSYKEAAEALAVPVGTVMSRLFRGRRQLASALVDPITVQHLPEPAQAA